MKSKILTEERVKNQDRDFGSNLNYYPAMLEDDDGKSVPMLFTRNQLEVATKRAERNTEDIPEAPTFFEWLLGN